jgi:hypothetical protein
VIKEEHMQPRNPDWDNPNIPNQDWGQQNPNIPNYDPNAPAQQGRGIPGQQAPIQGNLYAAPTGSPYSDIEWKSLMATPLKVCKAMMLASPSGPIGLIQETKAMVDCLQALLKQQTPSPLLRELGQSAQRVVDAARSGNPQQVLYDLIGDSKDPMICRTDALNGCQQAAVLLRNTSPQDAAEYKQFTFNSAQKVAEAASESGILGMGGPRVSPEEQELLRDISIALGMQRA